MTSTEAPITAAPTVEQVLSLARRLSPRDQAQVVAALATHVAQAMPAEPVAAPRRPMTPDEARAALAEVRAHFAAQGPVSPTIAEDLMASRR